MKHYYAPKSKLGENSLALTLIFAVLLVVSWLAKVLLGNMPNANTMLIGIPILAAVGAAIIAFFTGMAAVVRDKERSVAVYLSIAVGIFVIFVVMEYFLQH